MKNKIESQKPDVSKERIQEILPSVIDALVNMIDKREKEEQLETKKEKSGMGANED